MAKGLVVPTSTGNVSGVPAGGAYKLRGWSMAETGGTNAVQVVIRDGGSGGNVIGAVSMVANAQSQVWFTEPDPPYITGQLHFTITGTGVLSGAVFMG